MRTSDVLEKLGGVAATARLLDITHSAVCQWGERPPLLRQYQLARLRPELFSAPAEAESAE